MFLIELTILVILAIQDFKERQVSLILLVALFLYKTVDLIFFNLQQLNWLVISANIFIDRNYKPMLTVVLYASIRRTSNKKVERIYRTCRFAYCCIFCVLHEKFILPVFYC